MRLPDGRAAASVRRRGAAPVIVVAYGVIWMHCTRAGCYWTRVGCTLGGCGLRAVCTTLGQWIPTLVEQADSRRLWAGPASNHDQGTQRRRQPGSGAGGPVTEAPGSAARAPDSLLSSPVSTALTLTGPTPKYPTGIVGICGFSPASGAEAPVMSAPWTPTPRHVSPLGRPRLQGHRPAQGSRPSECLRSHDTHMSQK